MSVYPSTARAAHEELARLAAALSDPDSRAQAKEELRRLADLAAEAPEDAPLRLARVEAAVGARSETLELFLLPTTFAPEDWAYTFLEGLLKLPVDEYAGKKLVEVGTGSGWIPIALSKFTPLARIVGVDLNPQSPAVAVCNAHLNCDEEQLSRMEFGVSDLLRGLPVGERWDFVVGCIPQVLREEGDSAEAALTEEQALYDLSNYCAIQNVYEDHFGLGLIARLLDECPERLAPSGRLLLNLAGRPGRAIIERMFSRRGFATEVLVARRVKQAADTDIRPLVSLEKQTEREFEFFVHQHSAEPIRAETALGWLGAGNPIWHEVAVWQARPALPRETLVLRRALRNLGAEWLLDEIDLGAASQEQLDFVAALAERLAESPLLPYAHEAGDVGFRRLIARYLERFFELQLDEEEIFVAPERQQAIYSLLLATCDPGDSVLISRNVHETYAATLDKAGVKATVTNNTLREIKRLLAVFDVKVAILSVEPSERSNLSALREIVDEAARRGILVLLDESPFFHITSGVEPHTLFEFLAREPHRPNLVVLYGLVKNAVYSDFELTFLLPMPKRLQADLEIAAEVSYSRVSTPVQFFYERLLSELLSFRIRFAAPAAPSMRREPEVPLPRSARIARLAAFPAFAPRFHNPDDPELIRLDYGENEAPVPQVLAEGLVAAAVAPVDAAPEHGLEEAISAFLLETRGVRYEPAEIAHAQGVWPLIHDLAWALSRQLGRPARFFVATPCYGIIPPTLVAAGAQVIAGPLAELYELRGERAPDAVLISQPINPLGSYLPREELVTLAAYASEEGCRIVSDEIFGLVNLTHTAAETVRSPVTLEQAVSGTLRLTVLLGGLSKEFAAGGLRVGWLASHDRELVEEIRRAALGRLQLVAARAASHLYAAFGRTASGKLLHPRRHRSLREHLLGMRKELAEKRAKIVAALPPGSVDEGMEAGGLFLAPKMDAWLGREAFGTRLDPENLPRVIYEHTGLLVNGGAWCGEEERIRLVFSLPREKIDEAAERLKRFAALFEGEKAKRA